MLESHVHFCNELTWILWREIKLSSWRHSKLLPLRVTRLQRACPVDRWAWYSAWQSRWDVDRLEMEGGLDFWSHALLLCVNVTAIFAVSVIRSRCTPRLLLTYSSLSVVFSSSIILWKITRAELVRIFAESTRSLGGLDGVHLFP